MRNRSTHKKIVKSVIIEGTDQPEQILEHLIIFSLQLPDAQRIISFPWAD
jgi:hypothetical protein